MIFEPNDKEHVKELPIQFPFEPILDFYNDLYAKLGNDQICLTHRPGKAPFEDGCGSSYNAVTGERIYLETEFTEFAPGLPSHIHELIETVRRFSMNTFGKKIGRVRFIRLKMKTCLSYHTDFDEFRFHIPIQKDKKCFFVVDDLVFRMPNKGQLYFLRTNVPHTAVNASNLKDRIHLVFNSEDTGFPKAVT